MPSHPVPFGMVRRKSVRAAKDESACSRITARRGNAAASLSPRSGGLRSMVLMHTSVQDPRPTLSSLPNTSVAAEAGKRPYRSHPHVLSNCSEPGISRGIILPRSVSLGKYSHVRLSTQRSMFISTSNTISIPSTWDARVARLLWSSIISLESTFLQRSLGFQA
ncbi:hypothetical protein BOTBODRAFT_464074 [Botryobasidium botryosum FD-172 SS1]|uniref:Uncharacterized protein n=1 Tax=Botryobasidium botryosum (strain FD-172 SS1) TaxID=930990 RepID=A0A067M687_BOTB1|nr:hypothetical protein BOTBODRAFT_464074 [Botryobasidium botryosum FD-172 SS1]